MNIAGKIKNFSKTSVFQVAFLVLLFLVTRLVLLYVNIDSVYDEEEINSGTLTLMFVEGEIPSFDIVQYEPYHGGYVLSAILAVPFYLLFGPTVISFKMVALCYGVSIIIVAWYLLKTTFRAETALLFCLLFIFAPPVLIKNSLVSWGNYYESTLYTLLGFIFIKNIITEKAEILQYVLLGFLSGFILWCNYINVIAIICWGIFWMIMDRKSLFSPRILLAAGAFLTGLAPFFVNKVLNGSMVLSVYSKPLYEYFLADGIKPVLYKAYFFIVKGFPFSFLFSSYKKSGLISGYLWYLSFIVAFVFLIVLIFKAFLSSGGKDRDINGEWQNKLSFFLVLYVFVYSCFYLTSSFESQYICNFKDNRYLVPLYPVVLMIISIAAGYLLKSKRKVFVCLSAFTCLCLILSGYFSLTNIIFSAPFSENTNYRGYNFRGLALHWYHYSDAADFENKLKNWSPQYYPYLYQGFGWQYGWTNPSGGATGWEFNFNKDEFENLIRNLNPQFKGYAYGGLAWSFNYACKGNASKILEHLKDIPDEYKEFFLRQAVWNGESYPSNPEQWLFTVKDYPDRFKHIGYEGIGERIFHRYGNAPSRAEAFLEVIPRDYRCNVVKGLTKNKAELRFIDDTFMEKGNFLFKSYCP